MDGKEYFYKHVNASVSRFLSNDYAIGKVFQKPEYDWQGDWEGRELLALTNLYEITGKKLPVLDEFFGLFPQKCNSKGFLGEVFNENAINEQQLSGHGWLLRGLCEYYENFKDEKVLFHAKSVVENLFLNIYPFLDEYPTEKVTFNMGEVSGNLGGTFGRWKLSTDIGCLFIPIDGLSHYLKITGDERVKALLDKLVEIFVKVDKLKNEVQTHATLSATRGILRLYGIYKDKFYLDTALSTFDLYLKNGMTLTYENFNWFNRLDTWTEPCAVVDSLIVSVTLFNLLHDDKYRVLARKVWFNGLSFCHRANGGAGPNSCVTKDKPVLTFSMFEAPFCCTMRYCEGLKCVFDNIGLFGFCGQEYTDESGRKFVGDVLKVSSLKTGKEYLITDLCFGTEDEVKEKYSVIY